MPGGNGTGPTGQGSGTGRGMGRGRGQGRGRMGGPFAAGPEEVVSVQAAGTESLMLLDMLVMKKVVQNVVRK